MQTSAYYTQRINAERLNNNQSCDTRPPEYGVVGRQWAPRQALVQSLLLVLIEMKEAATVLVQDLECTINSQ